MVIAKILTFLLVAGGVYGLPAVTRKCPNGFRYVNGVTQNVMYDDRDIKTCHHESADSCIIIKYIYKTPEAVVNAEWNMPCFNAKKLPSFNLNTLFPEAALPIDVELKVCLDDDCVDFTPAAKKHFHCNSGVTVTNLDSGEVLVNDVSKEHCKVHQNGCYTMSQKFQQDGTNAERVVGGCYDEWRSYDFIWDRFYPYTDFSGDYCEKNGCIAFKVWHKDGFDTRTCYCTGDNKPPATYDGPVVTTCEENMCNEM